MTKANFNQIKIQQDVEKKEPDVLIVPGVLEKKKESTETILSPSGHGKEKMSIGKVRQLVEQKLQEQYLLSDLCQLTEIKENGTFRFTTGRGADTHLFKARWRVDKGQILIDFNKITQTYQTDPPPMPTQEEIEKAKEEEKEEVNEPLIHPDSELRKREYGSSPDQELKTTSMPPMKEGGKDE